MYRSCLVFGSPLWCSYFGFLVSGYGHHHQTTKCRRFWRGSSWRPDRSSTTHHRRKHADGEIQILKRGQSYNLFYTLSGQKLKYSKNLTTGHVKSRFIWLLVYRDNLFLKRSIPTVCFAHMEINPSTWDASLMWWILYKIAIHKVVDHGGRAV